MLQIPIIRCCKSVRLLSGARFFFLRVFLISLFDAFHAIMGFCEIESESSNEIGQV